MKKIDIIPKIIKNLRYLKIHCKLNERYINYNNSNFLSIDYAISHFQYEKYLVKNILDDLRIIKKIKKIKN